MIIKNTSPKIVNIGTTMLLPDKTMTITPVVANTPAIKAFIRTNVIAVVPEEVPEQEQPDPNETDDTADPETDDTQGTKTPKPRGRKKKEEETENNAE